jgi:probable F420-dependent oxidoreductase
VDLGRLGIWWSAARAEEPGLADLLAGLEQAGYGALWMSGGFRPGLSPRFAEALQATARMVVASGIVSIWLNEPAALAAAVGELDAAHPGRFLLGLGVSHAPLVEHAGHRYERPYSRMASYLDALDGVGGPVGKDRRVLAALGPRMLRLARERAAGAHPYFVPVAHTARARAELGDGPLLAPELAAVVETDASVAREVARRYAETYLRLPNYANNLRSLGFGEEDLAGGGSDRLVDAVVAWGDIASVAERVREHLRAGADHVCVQLLAADGRFPAAAYRELAAALDA